MATVKFKKGDRVRLKKFPDQEGTVTRVGKTMIWCDIGGGCNCPFAEPSQVELIEG
tara:strand:- start:5549 stop:5716 length:168 start_codon:yes stop_codon:yes gene_type:complete